MNQGILVDLKIQFKNTVKLFGFCDNETSATNLVEDPIKHDEMNHIDAKKHFIKEKLESKVMRYSVPMHQSTIC